MGQGQEPVALRGIDDAIHNGSWLLLQNCELGLGLMSTMEQRLKHKYSLTYNTDEHLNFRLFLTANPHPEFPLGLLQMSLKTANEPQLVSALASCAHTTPSSIKIALTASTRASGGRCSFRSLSCTRLCKKGGSLGRLDFAFPMNLVQVTSSRAYCSSRSTCMQEVFHGPLYST